MFIKQFFGEDFCFPFIFDDSCKFNWTIAFDKLSVTYKEENIVRSIQTISNGKNQNYFMWKLQRFFKYLNPYDQAINLDHFGKNVKNASKILADVSFNESQDEKKSFLGAAKLFTQ